ncbi:RluA family pseudouridine synthase [Salimicrobium halophilum]|uniref:Pseudouridine synthase n=1 Tax=Salimicrobium halophilum TaxID=86666 RepID=A0A1G8TU60_9BACI|nr:RluA family pseudouridine synthase [Salimicrobium halophilum]SDJ45019.1 23S rRNA pseudouridine1911/1915/1917 synthase [Salimicrobium halophilum]
MRKVFSVSRAGTVQEALRLDASLSRRMVREIKRSGTLLLNGKPVLHYEQVKEGDSLTVHFPVVDTYPYEPEYGPLDIAYEDEDLLIIDKPEGMAMTPSAQHPSHTIVQRVLSHYEASDWKQTVHPVTRLDRDTSGLLLIAKHPYIHSLFNRKEMIRRSYLALVEGVPEQEQGTICASIARAEDSIIRRKVAAGGKEAVTHYKVVDTDEGRSIIQLELETGRTHQIRVHMASLGHPLVGDTLYGAASDLSHGQALHSAKLSFTHPWTKEAMSFSSSPPFV